MKLRFPPQSAGPIVVLLLTVSTGLVGTPSRTTAAEATPASVTVRTNIAYKSGSGLTDYERERCMLDLYLPTGQGQAPVLVWFHGGGLKEGDKTKGREIALSLASAGLAVVVPNYRLSPRVNHPVYVEDAAAAVAWAHSHMSERGGDPGKLFVGGHSAGAWLAFMVGLDKRYLAEHNLSPRDLTGLIPVSGQTMTHFTVREERGIGRYTITIDEAAPVHYIRPDTPPMLLLYADNDMVARAEENQYFVALMKGVGNAGVSGRMIRDRDHGTVAYRIADEGDPGREEMLRFIALEADWARP